MNRDALNFTLPDFEKLTPEQSAYLVGLAARVRARVKRDSDGDLKRAARAVADGRRKRNAAKPRHLQQTTKAKRLRAAVLDRVVGDLT